MTHHMRGFRLSVLIVALVVAASMPLVSLTPARATGGELDPSFGQGGVALVDTTRPSIDAAWAAIGDTDAEVVSVAGSAGDRMAVARYHRSGTPASFGGDGLVTADFGVPAVAFGMTPTWEGFVAVGQAGGDLAAAGFDVDGRPRAGFGSAGRLVVPLGGASVAEAVSPEGVVVGSVVQGGDRDLVLAKLDGAGLVASFNGSGTRIVDLAPGADDEGLAVLATPDATRFYVAGRAGGSAVVARFNATTGALDASFGINGSVTLDLTAGADVGRALHNDGSGGLYVVGQASDRAFAARLSSSGLPVAGFGGGVVQFDLGGSADVATGIVWEPTGVVVGGTRTTPAGTDGAARRLTDAGAVDPAFGSGGLLVADFGSAADRAAAAVPLKDGRFALAGGDGSDMVIARFTASGAVDSYLDPDGRTTIDGNGIDWGGVARLAPDGRIVVGGSSGSQLVLARRLADGQPDPGFGSGGIVLDEIGGGVVDLAVQPDGRIVVLMGTGDRTYGIIGRLVRYLGDGRRDLSFGDGGLGGFVRSPGPRMVLQADGRILVAGWAPTGGLGVARFLSSGVPDPSFGDGGYADGGIGDDRVVLAVGGIAVQSDGNVLLAVGFTFDRVLVARFSPAGALLAHHGSYVGSGGAPPVIAVMGDDRFYLAGTTASHDSYGRPVEEYVTVARLRRDGTHDSDFAESGIARFDLGDHERVTDVVMDGTLLTLAVSTSSGLDMTTRVYRMASNGALDTRFGTSGAAAVPAPYIGETLVRDGDGRLVLGGIRTGDSTDIAVIRLQPGPTGEPPPPTSPTTSPPPTPPAPARRTGYWMLSRAGTSYAFGDAAWMGNAPTSAAADLEPTPSGRGYWVVDAAGAVYAFGDARYLGGAGASLTPGESVTSLSATPDGSGYWLFTDRGRVLPFGGAVFRGDMGGVRLNGPVLDSVATPSGAGYYLVASDGGIFAFGDAAFKGSMGGRPLNSPVQSLVPDADGSGYWLVASDGGVFAFEAPFRGSMGGQRLNRPMTGMVRYGNGYLMVGEDGGIFNFSDKAFAGSLGASPPASPIVAVAVLDQV